MKVSIIIPVYNVEAYINDCLYSVLNQNYKDLEIILVDDCGNDKSMEIADKLISAYNGSFNIKRISHECNKGLSAARNSGVRESIGEWLYFLDSDDEIYPDCISDLVGLVKEYPNVAFTSGGIEVIGSHLKFPILSETYLNSKNQILTDYIARKWYVMACNKLINRDFFVKNDLWFEDRLIYEDELFSFMLAVTAHAAAFTKKKTYIYKIRQDGAITSQISRKHLEAFFYINSRRFIYIGKHLELFREVPFFTFLVNSSYGFMKTVIACKTIDIPAKDDFIERQKAIYGQVDCIKVNANIFVLLKAFLLGRNIRLLKLVLRVMLLLGR